MTCAEVDDSAPGYALDILDPSHRSSVASHLLRCGRCRETVSRTQASADQLLDLDSDLVPSTPYPDDFWDDPDLDWVRPRRRLRVAATMAAVVALLVGTALGPEIEAASRPSPSLMLSVPLIAGNSPVGSVRVYAGQPPILQIEVTSLGGHDNLQADLIDVKGHIESFGAFRVNHGKGAWVSTEPKDMPNPKSLIVSDSSGKVLAQAALS